MVPGSDGTAPRPTGEAAWRAERAATEQRNAAAKHRAREQASADVRAAATRERRQEAAESAQLQVLNERLRARAAGRDPIG